MGVHQGRWPLLPPPPTYPENSPVLLPTWTGHNCHPPQPGLATMFATVSHRQVPPDKQSPAGRLPHREQEQKGLRVRGHIPILENSTSCSHVGWPHARLTGLAETSSWAPRRTGDNSHGHGRTPRGTVTYMLPGTWSLWPRITYRNPQKPQRHKSDCLLVMSAPV